MPYVMGTLTIYSNDGKTVLLYDSGDTSMSECQIISTGFTSHTDYTYTGDKKFLGLSRTPNTTTPDYPVGSTFTLGQSVDEVFYIVEGVNFETEHLSGSWIVDPESPGIPYETIPYDYGQDQEETLYNTYHLAIKPIWYIPGGYTIYGGTPYLTCKDSAGNTAKRLICKIKYPDEDYYRYPSFNWIDIDYNYITITEGDYNKVSVDWFLKYSKTASTTIQYLGAPLINLAPGQKATIHCEGKLMQSDLVIDAESVLEELKLQEKTITLSESCEITPDPGYQGLSKITVILSEPETQTLTITDINSENSITIITPIGYTYMGLINDEVLNTNGDFSLDQPDIPETSVILYKGYEIIQTDGEPNGLSIAAGSVSYNSAEPRQLAAPTVTYTDDEVIVTDPSGLATGFNLRIRSVAPAGGGGDTHVGGSN